jgi:hypothetical protein
MPVVASCGNEDDKALGRLSSPQDTRAGEARRPHVSAVTANDLPTQEAVGKVLRKALSPEVLALEARLALAEGVDRLG